MDKVRNRKLKIEYQDQVTADDLSHETEQQRRSEGNNIAKGKQQEGREGY